MMPVYNAEKYLQEAIDSVLNQTYTDYELILVNDGSIDSSLAICRNAKKVHPTHVTLIEQENKGLFEARKSGIRKAQGEYILSVDSDDMIAPDTLETLNSELSAAPVDVIAFRCCRNKEYERDGFSLYFSLNIEKGQKALDAARRALLTTDSINNLAFKCIRRTCLDGLATSKDRNLLMAEDKMGCAFVLDSAKSYRQIESILYFYRPNELSITGRRYMRKRYDDLNAVMSTLESYLRKWCFESLDAQFRALYLSQACVEIDSLYHSGFSSQEIAREAAHIKSSPLFRASALSANMKRLRFHKRFLLYLFLAESSLTAPYLRIYRIGTRVVRASRG